MSKIWTIADLHLSFGVPGKEMDIFGEQWINHPKKIEKHWKGCVNENDLVLIPGDISWAKTLDEARPDMEWIHRLPGTKLLLRGNHDYWWTAISKVRAMLPPSMHAIQHDTFTWNGVEIGGARMWDTPEYDFDDYIMIRENPKEVTAEKHTIDEDEKIFVRELGRLETSLKAFTKNASSRIVMTHYPPISADLGPSRIHTMLEKYKVDFCTFGHLHSVKAGELPFGEKNGVKYVFAACDYIDFTPILILEV
jgi:predicted phosphohydrolase